MIRLVFGFGGFWLFVWDPVACVIWFVSWCDLLGWFAWVGVTVFVGWFRMELRKRSAGFS